MRASGRAQAHSDVDIAVFVDERALRRQDYGYYNLREAVKHEKRYYFEIAKSHFK